MVQAAIPKPVHWVLFTGQRLATAFPSRWAVCYPVSFHSSPVDAGTGAPKRQGPGQGGRIFPKKSWQKRSRLFRIRCRSGRWPVSNS